MAINQLVPCVSVFKRLGQKRRGEMKSSRLIKEKVNNWIKEFASPSASTQNNLWYGSFILLRMIRCTYLIMQRGRVLKVKEHTIVYTRIKKDDEESIASCNHITTVDGELLRKKMPKIFHLNLKRG